MILYKADDLNLFDLATAKQVFFRIRIKTLILYIDDIFYRMKIFDRSFLLPLNK